MCAWKTQTSYNCSLAVCRVQIPINGLIQLQSVTWLTERLFGRLSLCPQAGVLKFLVLIVSLKNVTGE